MKPLLFAPLLLACTFATAQTPTSAATPAAAPQRAVATPTPAPQPTRATPSPASPSTPVPPPPTLSAKSWVLMDYLTGQVLASHEPDARVAPASITKVMTSYVISSELAAGKIRLEDPVHISEHAWRGGGAATDGSTSFLPVNQSVPLKDLLYGMVIQSGNDASIALAEHAAGSEQTFAELMNQHARRLDMSGTHYVNSHGLHAEDHYTTARDVALLSQALIRDHPADYPIYAIKEFTYNGITQHNRNTLLWRDASIDGIKTGHHSQAGYCLAASAKRGDVRMIAVVMGTSGEKVRADEAQALLEYGFRFFESHLLYAANATVAEPQLWKGTVPAARLGLAQAATITIPRGAYSRLQATVNVQKPLIAPLAKGQKVGTLVVTLDGKPVHEAPLVALADFPLGGFFKRLSDGAVLWWQSD
ncbi:MAG TPA: D-alanyl-D-alanine carboxypeptidase family protein [Candidatus Saccharimonadia bacterium]|nr:D-alanyl-D-alanine carboxypeptidase family protein [Candidatus Saccharimonadia bacterium]